jgi:hypothetical protein
VSPSDPEDLVFSNPICPECYTETTPDGSSWGCEGCHASWDGDGRNGERADDSKEEDAPDVKEANPDILPGTVLHHLPERGTPGETDRYVVLRRYFGFTDEVLAVSLITRTGELDPEYAHHPPHCIGVETPYSHDLWAIERTDTP